VESKNVSESFQAAKIRELDHKLRDPMWADGNKHYYIGELAQLKGGQLIVPLRWFRLERNGPVHAEGVLVTHDPIVRLLCSILSVAAVYNQYSNSVILFTATGQLIRLWPRIYVPTGMTWTIAS
jgi:hypothetical protein